MTQDSVVPVEDQIVFREDIPGSTLQKVYRTLLSFDATVISVIDSEDVVTHPNNWTIAC